MSDREDLPSWTGQQDRSATQPGAANRSANRGRTLVLAVFGLAVLVGMGAVGYYIAETLADDGETATEGDGSSVDTDGEDSDLESAAPDSDGDGSGDDQDGGAEAETDDTTSVDVEDESDGTAGTGEDAASDDGATGAEAENQSTRTAVFRGGVLYLGGRVPSQEVADLITERAAAVVGPDNLVVEYKIDPTVELDANESTPLYVEDVVLFDFNSVTIEPAFTPLLDLGVLLLSQNPQATITVVTRTDAVGSEEVNLDVATKRAQEVIDYYVRKGVNPDQLVADPRGEEGASEDDDEEAAALQRRAEFIITGLLD